MTKAMPPTAPDTYPTVCIITTGSFDFGAIVPMKRKKPAAAQIMMMPAITSRQFVRRIFPRSAALAAAGATDVPPYSTASRRQRAAAGARGRIEASG